MMNPTPEAVAAARELAKTIWETVCVAREAHVVHSPIDCGCGNHILPTWDSLDDVSRLSFQLLAVGPVSRLMAIADVVVEDQRQRQNGGQS